MKRVLDAAARGGPPGTLDPEGDAGRAPAVDAHTADPYTRDEEPHQ